MERGEKRTSTVEKHDHLSEGIKVSINNDNSYWWCVPWYDITNMGLFLCGRLPWNLWPQSNHERHIGEIPIEDHGAKRTSVLNIVKAIKTKESLRNPHSQEEPKEIWQLKAIWYPEWDHESEKGHLVKIKIYLKFLKRWQNTKTAKMSVFSKKKKICKKLTEFFFKGVEFIVVFALRKSVIGSLHHR